jgi:hypothetical protein
VVRSGDLVAYAAEEGIRILAEGKFLVSDPFPGNDRNKYCLSSKVFKCLLVHICTKSLIPSIEVICNLMLHVYFHCDS